MIEDVIMAGRPVTQLEVSEDQRMELERCIRCDPPRYAKRALAIYHRVNGISQAATAQKLNWSERSVSKWVAHFRKFGVDGLSRKERVRDKPEMRTEAERSLSMEKSRPIQTAFPDHDSGKTRIDRSMSPPGMRMVASQANVSVMTVSRVMRNSPKVSPALKERVLKSAREIGYRPDPEVGKLMTHLRHRKTIGLKGVICSLEAKNWDYSPPDYFKALLKGARERAKSLGFAWESYPLEAFIQRPEHALNVLYNRGIDGILLPPLPGKMGHIELPNIQAWTGFSVITTTYAISFPLFRRVVPDHFKNIMCMCDVLSTRGCKRIGLIIPETLDERVSHRYSGGYAAFHFRRKQSILRPFFHHDSVDIHDSLLEWYEREKPDALILSNHQTKVEMMNRAPFLAQLPVGVLTHFNDLTSGIDELPSRIGTQAVEGLGDMILRNEKYDNKAPVVTMVPGVWKEATGIEVS